MDHIREIIANSTLGVTRGVCVCVCVCVWAGEGGGGGGMTVA